MTDRFPALLRLTTLALALAVAGQVSAQGLRNTAQLASPPAAAAGVARTADFIVALVNSEPLTNNEVRLRVQRLEQQFSQQGRPMPPRAEIVRQVLDQLINERVQMQHATEVGIRVSDDDVNQAEQAVAAQNGLSVEEFRRRLNAEGVIDTNRLRADLRQQITLQRLREREVEGRVKVTEADIDDHIREQQGGGDLASLEMNLGHVLVAVPEGADAARVAELQARAQRVADRARAGEDFAALAREFSDSPERNNGGQFGLRPASRLPDLFVNATRTLANGGIAGPLRSGAGFHVLKVIEKRQAGLPDMVVTQTRARHILLVPTAQLSQAQAQEKLAAFRQQIVSGQARFEDLAREHSQDGSAATGGDLGWAAPGQFVPEFEQVMNAMRPGEVSQPLVSRFGVHLIRVEERRQNTLSQRDQREVVRNVVREKKVDEAFDLWMQDLRARAYVELREAPQL
ncbi:peptidylprolyl isomerase [Hydrogenophaga sp.]|uniref:peptidylprolyl isomerase n=1 Tax=Hydrogenophaga sp. TaxID=1904254 RepID=UPI003918BD5A